MRRASDVTGDRALLTDERTGESFDLTARAVISATGVWAGEIDPGLRLRPSRGTHLVLTPPRWQSTAALTVPIPGELNRFVFAMP
jgi:glycerol-3-phosphate dehydrogenase